MVGMSKTKETSAEAIATIIALVENFDSTDRSRILRTVSAYFVDAEQNGLAFRGVDLATTSQSVPFSNEASVSPKQFMMEKKPHTDTDRVACLAYYLTHHRNTNHFKTIDISRLNTEAAQLRFSNPAQAVDNAFKRGFLALATKGHKQLSAFGEQYVQALPDREAAKAIQDQVQTRRRRVQAKSRPKKSGKR
jgi:hypothetical protein